VSDVVGDYYLDCSQMCTLVQNTGMNDYYGLVESMICVAWLESRWDPSVTNSYSGAAGLWQFLPQYFVNQGNCPTDDQGFYDAQQNANCMAWVVENEGLSPWANEPTECANCVWHSNCAYGTSGYVGCMC